MLFLRDGAIGERINYNYGKLRRCEGKSGQAARKKSVLQQWKMRALAFLDPYILRRMSGSEMGRDSLMSSCIKVS